MELNKIFFPIRKWWWLLLASTVVATIFSFVTILRQPTIYQARTILMIGTAINDPNPSSFEFALGQQLAAAYTDLANREIVRDATMRALSMNRLPAYFARAIPNTQLIEILVTDTEPARAQVVANELAAQLVLLSPTSSQPENQDRQDFINQQLNNFEVQIQETEDEIERLEEELSTLVSAQQIADTREQIFALQSKLNIMQDRYGSLLSNTKQGAVNTLTIIEYATPSSTPIGPNKGMTVLLAAAIGFVLAASVAYLLEYLDDSMKSADDVDRLFSAPIIGHIFEQEEVKNEKNQLYDADDLGHPIAEAFRALRTNIEFSQGDRPLKTILVASADIGDGKTTVASNLALSIAQRDKEVVLLDVDLRRPSVHEFFELSNDRGLVDLISARADNNDVLQFKKARNVAVLTTGETPPNPTELLSSKKMDELLLKLGETSDVVIIDGPPFIVADAMVMASKVDGVLLVVRPGHTRRSLAQGASEKIKLAGARLIGVVLNRIPLRGADYYAGKSHVYTYYASNYGDERKGNIKKTEWEKMRATLSPYVNKVSVFVKHIFEAVFKLSPK